MKKEVSQSIKFSKSNYPELRLNINYIMAYKTSRLRDAIIIFQHGENNSIELDFVDSKELTKALFNLDKIMKVKHI